jgi:hypothetical protein
MIKVAFSCEYTVQIDSATSAGRVRGGGMGDGCRAYVHDTLRALMTFRVSHSHPTVTTERGLETLEKCNILANSGSRNSRIPGFEFNCRFGADLS